MIYLSVGIGGALGTVLRYLLSIFIPLAGVFPLATFVINAVGSMLLGFFTSWFLKKPANPIFAKALTTGTIGSFTTFSTFTNETITILADGAAITACLYVLSSLITGFAFIWAGLFLGRRLASSREAQS